MSATASALLTRAEVAQQLGVSQKTVSRMVRDGELPTPLTRNRRWHRWFASDVANVLKKLAKQRQEGNTTLEE